jgi:hypothetical protein
MNKRQIKPQPGPFADSRAAESMRDGSAAASNLLAAEAVHITRALVLKAIDGNMKALRLCIERLVPLSRERALPVKIPAAQDALQITLALQAVFDGLGAGYLTAGEAQKLAALLENQRKAIETSDLEERLRALESGSPRDIDEDRAAAFDDLPRQLDPLDTPQHDTDE